MTKTNDRPSVYEKLILTSILHMNKGGKRFFQTNKKIAEILDISQNSVAVMISRLISMGYIKKIKENGYRYLEYTGKEFKQLPFYMDYKLLDSLALEKRVKELEEQNVKLKIENEKLKNKEALS